MTTPSDTICAVLDAQEKLSLLQHEIAELCDFVNQSLVDIRDKCNISHVTGRFVLNGMTYQMVHKAIGYGIRRNQYWLEVDRDTRVIPDDSD